jgi:hypothetical protein
MKNVGPKHKAKELQKLDHRRQKTSNRQCEGEKKLKFLILFYTFDFRQKDKAPCSHCQ